MAAQARIGAALATAAGAVWMGLVYKERSELPVGRRRLFSPGSADDVMSGDLKDGDLVLFARNCALYYPCGAAACAATKALTGIEYDHAGVIVRRKGTACVAEATFSGVRLRPFEERVVCSRALNVVVRQLARPLSPEQRTALREAALAAEADGAGSPESPGAWAVAAVTAGPAAAAERAPAALANRLYRAAGLLEEGEAVSLRDAVPAYASRYDADEAAIAGAVVLGQTLWFRDRTST